MKSILRAGIGLAAMASMNGMALAQELPTKVGAGEGAVNIVAWVGYIERGESDAAYDWVTDFEKKTSCKVNVKTASTSDEMVALMNEGGYDLVTASGDASLRLVQACGRLLRTEQDRGTISLLDRRVVTQRYGKAILNALPPFRREIA